MKSSDRTILVGVGIAAAVIVFLLVVLMPKRSDADKLGTKVAEARSALEQTEQQVAFASQARKSFPTNYRRLVVLGKAVPSSDDTSSLLVELNSVSRRSGVQFRGIEVAAGAVSAAAAPAPAPAPSAESGQQGSKSSASKASATQTPPAAATEASAASLPIGATVGSAGLPVIPYKLTFAGSFFRVADFISGVQKLVSPKAQHVTVSGRLMTIDGFSLSRDDKLGFPHLKVSVAVTTYMTPQQQGLTAGATQAGPAPVEQPSTTNVSNPGATP
ncbi:MAG: hypothetical protein QOG26_580 [Solirubrobacterales bacterium]|jgi:Tfp pilus assembly protein PilO|nr:hypothetical protein [Solirubrobacterales bacterium]